jgi:hypothetical protein
LPLEKSIPLMLRLGMRYQNDGVKAQVTQEAFAGGVILSKSIMWLFQYNATVQRFSTCSGTSILYYLAGRVNHKKHR